MPTHQQLELKSKWSIVELARAFGYYTKKGNPDRRKTKRELIDQKVPIFKGEGGRTKKQWVYLLELQRAWPEGWLNILRIAELKRSGLVPVSVGKPPEGRLV